MTLPLRGSPTCSPAGVDQLDKEPRNPEYGSLALELNSDPFCFYFLHMNRWKLLTRGKRLTMATSPSKGGCMPAAGL
ncbi:hypothetical protein EYF80_056960 [Liparis tanakae]|uniref:Uncharacterized protein n=1 Tax=Liparis tanakae TaxID=230148 RepID=A0A4Z2EX92_9TELE|nr:hypothetical protein EYF80_056960 [Liparis tanakae]